MARTHQNLAGSWRIYMRQIERYIRTTVALQKYVTNTNIGRYKDTSIAVEGAIYPTIVVQ